MGKHSMNKKLIPTSTRRQSERWSESARSTRAMSANATAPWSFDGACNGALSGEEVEGRMARDEHSEQLTGWRVKMSGVGFSSLWTSQYLWDNTAMSHPKINKHWVCSSTKQRRVSRTRAAVTCRSSNFSTSPFHVSLSFKLRYQLFTVNTERWALTSDRIATVHYVLQMRSNSLLIHSATFRWASSWRRPILVINLYSKYRPMHNLARNS
jgi:hypothetical protein